MSNAREAILGRIREALAGSAKLTYADIERGYRQSRSLDAQARVALFEDRLRDYGCPVYRCGAGEIRATVAAALSEAQKRSALIPAGFPKEWLPEGFAFQPDVDLSYLALDRSEGVVTTCAIAIAESGTIILRHSEQDGRRALTLIPDYHLCIIRSTQIVATVVEGLRLAAQFGNEPITTISGPSATSDIEMTRIKGVHGPRTLAAVILD